MVGFITVRTSSSRLKKKCLLQFHSSKTIIDHIINRSKIFGIEPIVCTSTHKSDDIIESIAKKKKVKCFRGSLDNKISRWYHCAKYFNVKYFHTIDADDPFFDGNRMIDSLKILIKNKLDFVKPSDYSDNGGASEGYSISTDFIEKVYYKNKKDNLDTEMAIYYFNKFTNSKNETLKDPEYKIKINTMIPRLTLDYFEDYIFLNSLSFIIDNNEKRNKIEEFLLDNSYFNKINIHLNELWKKKQLSKKI